MHLHPGFIIIHLFPVYAVERAAGDILTMRLPAFHGKTRKQKAGSVVERRRKATLPAV